MIGDKHASSRRSSEGLQDEVADSRLCHEGE